MLEGVDGVTHFITVNEQSESTPDCTFHSSVACFAFRRSYHRNLLTFFMHLCAEVQNEFRFNIVKLRLETSFLTLGNFRYIEVLIWECDWRSPKTPLPLSLSVSVSLSLCVCISLSSSLPFSLSLSLYLSLSLFRAENYTKRKKKRRGHSICTIL